MEDEKIKKVYKILDSIPVTDENEELIEEIRKDLDSQNYVIAFKKIESLAQDVKNKEKEKLKKAKNEEKIKNEENKNNKKAIFPEELENDELERNYMGLLLNNPEYIIKYHFLYDECYFEDQNVLNAYKSVLFTEGGNYTPEIAKQNFNFAKDNEESYNFKAELKKEVESKRLNMEKIYTELKKLFILRKSYLEVPIKEIQDKIIEIKDYELYNQMSPEEVKDAVVQINDTQKFKRAVLNKGLTGFLEAGDNNLRNGLPLPFPILNNVFKGIRKGETMAFAMPSNSGKSRFTIDIAAHTALVHKKKVLIISNEMSEDKMRLCLITTIINNKEIQKLHGKNIIKTE